ncbi:MAG: T9SS type A sorting domain-containing protein [Saprospiraceae bacterium]|nr:T9SS type A sorting domain-containing protein [Saprospiraceae bacterium]
MLVFDGCCRSTFAQPTCSASVLQLAAYEFNPNFGARVLITISPVEGTVSYAMRHRYQIDNETVEEEIALADLQIALMLNPLASLHEFTALTTCEDGTIAEGATFFLDFANASSECPPPINLVIEFVNNAAIGFRWNVNSQADRYQVNYTPQGGATQTAETPIPSFIQEIVPASVHTFEVRSICVVPGILNQADQYGPAYRFSIVTVDDIKAFKLGCFEMEKVVDTAYVLQCTKHGDFGPNKDSFLLVHKNVCLTAVREPVLLQTSIYPNPANDEISISFGLRQSSIVAGDLLNIQGQLLQNWLSPALLDTGVHLRRLYLGKHPPGIYLLRIQTQEQVFVQKIFKLP